jgi:lipoate-protein ligase A
MRFLDLTLPAPADNLALDEALLLQAEELASAGLDTEVLRLWEWPAHAVVLGAGCRLAEDVNEPACLAGGVPILRRSSGGGTVLLGAGCLCYSLVLRFEREPALTQIGTSYRYILGRLLEALAVEAGEQAGISDLVSAGRKFSGNAQQRKRDHLLHHGTILYAFDLDCVERFLRVPPRQPEYRAGRAHGEFLRNVSPGGEEVRRRLRAAWQVQDAMQDWPAERVRRLVAEKHALAEWVRRR